MLKGYIDRNDGCETKPNDMVRTVGSVNLCESPGVILEDTIIEKPCEEVYREHEIKQFLYLGPLG